SLALKLTMEIVGPQEIRLGSTQKSLELGPKDRQSLNVNVNVPLNTKPGDYHVTLKFKGPPNKDNVVVVTVEQNPIIGVEIPALENSLTEFNVMLDKLEASGVDVKDSRRKSENARRELDMAKKSIEDNDIAGLETHVAAAQALIEADMSTSITWLQMTGFLYGSVPLIVAGAVAALVVAYLFSRVLVPFLQLRKKVEDLERREREIMEARKYAEMQYFKREVDEETFRHIMEREQHALLTIRTQIKATRTKAFGLLGSLMDISEFRNFYKGLFNRTKPKESRHVKLRPPVTEKKRAEKWQKDIHKEMSKIDEIIRHRRGKASEEAKEFLRMAHSYSERNMEAMSRYYLEKAKKALD
ncbi:MAG: hypothetical protein ABIH90_03340, partial [Candidatus Aenigmatarchaeota archaeon]